MTGLEPATFTYRKVTLCQLSYIRGPCAVRTTVWRSPVVAQEQKNSIIFIFPVKGVY